MVGLYLSGMYYFGVSNFKTLMFVLYALFFLIFVLRLCTEFDIIRSFLGAVVIMMVIKGFDSILVNYPLTDNQIIYLIESHSNKMSDCELDKIEKWVLEEEDITPEKLIILNYNCLEAPLSREEKMESRRVLSEKILGRKFHE